MAQLVELSTGISLDVELESPTFQLENAKLAVCLHPWSWLGGRKNDPVLLSLIEQLLEENYHVIRYNSRGVGQSTGWPSLTGFSEAKDLEDLVNWAIARISNVKSLVLIGYSHGSLIASLHPILPTIKTSHILISYPLGPRGWLTLFHTGTYREKLKELVRDANSHVLVVFGDEDEFTSVSSYREWRQELENVSTCDQLRVVEVAKATHFWRGRSGLCLWEEIKGWLS